jgi:hypothetical protein
MARKARVWFREGARGRGRAAREVVDEGPSGDQARLRRENMSAAPSSRPARLVGDAGALLPVGATAQPLLTPGLLG